MEWKQFKKPANSKKDLATQKWLNILNFEDSQISNLGNVRTLIDGKWQPADYVKAPDGHVYVSLDHKAGFSNLLSITDLVISNFKPKRLRYEPSIYNTKLTQEQIDEFCKDQDEYEDQEEDQDEDQDQDIQSDFLCLELKSTDWKEFKNPVNSKKDLAAQKWLNIINFEDSQISDYGNVRSLIEGEWCEADLMIGPDGYVYVALLHTAGFNMLLNVSILVLSAFKPLKGQKPSIYNTKLSQKEINAFCEDRQQVSTFH